VNIYKEIVNNNLEKTITENIAFQVELKAVQHFYKQTNFRSNSTKRCGEFYSEKCDY
jgi:hypothetical protein